VSTTPTIRARMIGMQIRTRRRELGLTQTELADAIVARAFEAHAVEVSLSKVAVSQWESGRHEPALRYRPHIARVLDLDQRTLFPNIGANDMAAA
jgi:transcriptional regulator with XRE-family HTH domain